MALHHWSVKLFAAPLALAAALCFATSASAALIVNDTWQDGTHTDPASPIHSENGTDGDLDGDLESPWYQGGSGTLDSSGGSLQGTVGLTSSASWTTYFGQTDHNVVLANTGDNLKVTWVFTPIDINGDATGMTNNTSQSFRLAVVDSPAGARLAADGTPADGAFDGYAMFMNMSPTLGNSNPFRLMERNVASGNLLSSSGNWAPLDNGATSGNTGYVSGTEYTFMMSITRNALDGLDFDVTMSGGSLDNDGLAQVVFTDPTPDTFEFDTFAVRPSRGDQTASTFDTRLFTVEGPLPIPEPASLALAALGGFAVLGLGRRQR